MKRIIKIIGQCAQNAKRVPYRGWDSATNPPDRAYWNFTLGLAPLAIVPAPKALSYALTPPSTLIVEPLTNAAAGDARKATTAATSPARP